MVSTSYSRLTCALLFGGTAPLVITALDDAGHPVIFFWYVAAGAVIAFITLLTMRETKGSVL